ncbi:hypothetical protein KKC47_02505, partial [Patescibacteria group bacterium]|nr:hypothetical protein [Patescibacteria group bacterium]
CDSDANCVSGHCYDFEGWGGICIGPNTEPSSPCVPDGAAGQCGRMTCDPKSHTCISSTGGGR